VGDRDFARRRVGAATQQAGCAARHALSPRVKIMPALRLESSDKSAAPPLLATAAPHTDCRCSGRPGESYSPAVPPPQTLQSPAGQSAATPPWCGSPLPAAGKTSPWTARCVQTHAATPRAGPFLLRYLAALTLTHLESAARLYRRARINRLRKSCRTGIFQ
jgi:cell division septation protein DedD